VSGSGPAPHQSHSGRGGTLDGCGARVHQERRLHRVGRAVLGPLHGWVETRWVSNMSTVCPLAAISDRELDHVDVRASGPESLARSQRRLDLPTRSP